MFQDSCINRTALSLIFTTKKDDNLIGIGIKILLCRSSLCFAMVNVVTKEFCVGTVCGS